ncbi:hypothetical protein [Allorhodopirellula solitaria]|uniref:Uncharacterized protein n=1 Tax=Allorhodopirellula solitaria TaxID=2527987 RepID=A0A5C5WY04_9BACT|nr:hypothetical protein [Allorhodopirellula solitaria]TWT55488.1 hypothetical protein CA85_49010 [Allorhodopirellula solitaria]
MHQREIRNTGDWANRIVFDWATHVDQGREEDAIAITIIAIREAVSRDRAAKTLEEEEYILGCRVLLNALRDLANIGLTTRHPDWIKYPKAVEVCWDLSHDARERLTSYSGIDLDFARRWATRATELIQDIDSAFGPGLYCSWEMEFDGLICSICGNDVRGCEHIPGKRYGRKRCALTPKGGQPRAIAIVENPRDPRCRIWPWAKRREEDGHAVVSDIPIFKLFRLEGNDDGGSIVDLEELFQFVVTLASQEIE